MQNWLLSIQCLLSFLASLCFLLQFYPLAVLTIENKYLRARDKQQNSEGHVRTSQKFKQFL
jgi:hypothetical protein